MESALIEGDEYIGASLILASQDLDEGPIIDQCRYAITGPIRAANALSTICDGVFGLVSNLCTSLRNGGVTARPQDNSKATYSLWRDEFDYYLDWRQDAERIYRHILAVGPPYEGARTHLLNELVFVHDAEVVRPDLDIANRDPGKIFNIHNGLPLVVCGSGLLRLTDIRSASGSTPLVLTKIKQRFA